MRAITLHPDMHFGAPCINGTRLTVSSVVAFVAIGRAYELHEAYPGYDTGDFMLACWYAATHGKRHYRKAWRAWALLYEIGEADDFPPAIEGAA